MNSDIKPLIAKKHHSGFILAHDTYNALSVASDGKVYYVLSSEDFRIGGYVYVYDPVADTSSLIGDLTELCGEKDRKTIGQGKSHVEFYEMKGALYFATHAGVYELIDGMDVMYETPPEGLGLYPGGHILKYDLASGRIEDQGIVLQGEGIVSMTMDTYRGQIYGITWPGGSFFHFEVESSQVRYLHKIALGGEAGVPGEDFRVLCRSLVVDPRDGQVYFTVSEGQIMKYNPFSKEIRYMKRAGLALDYFGTYDPSLPGTMAYHWRKAIWYEKESKIIGVHGNSGYLFEFSPDRDKIEVIERLTSVPSKKSGMFDQFSYGYLGFTLGPDGETIYYLTGGPIYKKGNRLQGLARIAKGAAKGPENLHLITYHLPTNQYKDHGVIFFDDKLRPSYVNSIAVSEDRVYFLTRMNIRGNEIQDLAWIDKPK